MLILEIGVSGVTEMQVFSLTYKSAFPVAKFTKNGAVFPGFLELFQAKSGLVQGQELSVNRIVARPLPCPFLQSCPGS